MALTFSRLVDSLNSNFKNTVRSHILSSFTLTIHGRRSAEALCQLLSKIAELKLIGPITLVLDNARYQRNDEVMGLATRLNITLMFLPSYSPNLNLIERLWKFVKRRSIYGRYHPSFADFKAAIEHTLDQIENTHAADLASLMTLNFQQFENVSLMAA